MDSGRPRGHGRHAAVQWTTASTLPAGVTLSTAGELSGTPTETGSFPITATVTDDVDATDDVSFTLTVNEPAAPVTDR